MANWFYPQIAPFRVQGRGLAEDNFAAEDRRSEAIMGREGYQNPLDARDVADNPGAVRVVLKVLGADEFDISYLRGLLPAEFVSRLDEASGAKSSLDFEAARVLVIEDFGTTGLNGRYDDSTVDGTGENWNAFWFREGEGAKDGASNGRAGQGKITFYRTSQARAVFGLTVRKSDGKALLLGRSSFRRTYGHENEKFERDSFWCVKDDDRVIPISDDSQVDDFRRAFRLQRENECGLSLVIPFPGQLQIAELLLTAISDFYIPIARGRLEVQIGDELISKDNIDKKADELLPDDLARSRKSSFTKGFRSMVRGILEDARDGKEPVELELGWENGSLEEFHFPTDSLVELRRALEAGERVWVRCPVTVKPRSKEPVKTYFDIHLEKPQTLDKVEEAYVRRDLLIGSEAHLASKSYLPNARGLTLIEDDAMSAFLADAEEPTHLKWNGSRPRLAEDYKSPSNLVRAVRQALPRLLALLSGSEMARDLRALSKYFTKPVDDSLMRTPGGRNSNGRGTTPFPTPPAPRRKPLALNTGIDWISVRPNGSAAPTQEDLPIRCELEVAYEGLDSDPFAAFDPFDFDLTDTDAHTVEVNAASILSTEPNKIEFEILEPDFELKIDGFDANIRLRARLTYRENYDGTNINAQQPN